MNSPMIRAIPILYFHFQYRTDISAMNVDQYQPDISMLWMHTLMPVV